MNKVKELIKNYTFDELYAKLENFAENRDELVLDRLYLLLYQLKDICNGFDVDLSNAQYELLINVLEN